MKAVEYEQDIKVIEEKHTKNFIFGSFSGCDTGLENSKDEVFIQIPGCLQSPRPESGFLIILLFLSPRTR